MRSLMKCPKNCGNNGAITAYATNGRNNRGVTTQAALDILESGICHCGVKLELVCVSPLEFCSLFGHTVIDLSGNRALVCEVCGQSLPEVPSSERKTL